MTDGPHLSTDTISDFLEGLLSAADSQAADQHLASCAECSSTRDALVQVQDVLTSAPAAAPMPEHVVARIEEGLAGEVREREATAGATAGATDRATDGAGATHQREAAEPAPKRGLLERLGLVGPGGRAFKALAAAAALCLIGGAGAVAYRLTQDGPSDGSAPTAQQHSPSGQDESEDRPVGPSLDSEQFDADAGRYSGGEERQAGAPGEESKDTMTDLVFAAPKASAAQQECAAGAVDEAGGEQVERAYQAALDGTQVVVAVTENGDVSDGAGVAYAVSGCPDSPKILKKSTVSLN